MTVKSAEGLPAKNFSPYVKLKLNDKPMGASGHFKPSNAPVFQFTDIIPLNVVPHVSLRKRILWHKLWLFNRSFSAQEASLTIRVADWTVKTHNKHNKVEFYTNPPIRLVDYFQGSVAKGSESSY